VLTFRTTTPVVCLLLVALTSWFASPQKAAAPDQAALNTALLTAAANGEATRVKSLLESGADPNAVDKYGSAPLHLVGAWQQFDLIIGGKEEQHAETARVLLSHGADINARRADGGTPLIVAAGFNHLDTANALVQAGADVNLRDKAGRSALTLALHRGADDVGIVLPLLRKGAKVELIEALMMGDDAAAQRLAPTADLSLCGPGEESPLTIAALYGNTEVVRELLRRKVDVSKTDKSGLPPVIAAIGAQFVQGQSGFDWMERDKRTGRAKLVRLFLRAGAKVNARGPEGETALLGAVELRLTDVAHVLLENRANPNLTTKFGLTPLSTAVKSDDFALAELLLKRGAKPNLADDFYFLPLVVAVSDREKPHLKIISLLLDHGAAVNDRQFGRTPIMGAAHEGTVEAIRLLIKRGANINAIANDGLTALMLAAGWNSVKVVKELISQGADVMKRDSKGKTARDYAREQKNAESEAILSTAETTVVRRP
jgi:uncharacterized protein